MSTKRYRRCPPCMLSSKGGERVAGVVSTVSEITPSMEGGEQSPSGVKQLDPLELTMD